ncbi:unnamed protein product [Brugia timori]|uniref:Uncharacterized protein n=1 Tax=Brugia timori TaxID=42155 RepID=A0A0R3QM36_9BILA|nr:unnamed protein product [Brugia timori]
MKEKENVRDKQEKNCETTAIIWKIIATIRFPPAILIITKFIILNQEFKMRKCLVIFKKFLYKVERK